MEMNALDASNMRQVILDFPKQLEAGLALGGTVGRQGTFKDVVVCGMGGSGIPADIILALIQPILPITIHRDYGLPKSITQDSLVICVSYSGNTEETVSALTEAIGQKVTTVAMATGGAMESMCQEHGIPFVKLPGGIQPRSAIGYMTSALARILETHGAVAGLDEAISKAAKDLADVAERFEGEGKALANRLAGKIPLVYASARQEALAKIWKIRFNENAKIAAFYNVIPEMNHNELAGYEGIKKMPKGTFYALMLRDSENHPRVERRMDLTADIARDAGMDVTFLEAGRGTPAAKLFASSLLSDWTSYHLALLQGIDPAPVTVIEDFKKRLVS